MKNIDLANSTFWNEICGSYLAKDLGITDDSPASLEKYDNFYLNYYPYLLKHVPVESFKGKSVMEVGLGYGTLSQKIAENCSFYRGLDIADGPVKMVNKRLSQVNINIDAEAIVGSIKECPFSDNTFDAVVAIGCYHHTGDLRKAIKETSRVLKKGGTCYLMVYNKYSYRQWIQSPSLTFKRLVKEYFSLKSIDTETSESEKKAFDMNFLGEGAPETQFFSIKELNNIMMQDFNHISFEKENNDYITILRRINFKRETLLNNLGKIAGLDTYFQGKKK
jgi:ubiquinone/menaquinone biosynthesis C-methylase UbiE